MKKPDPTSLPNTRAKAIALGLQFYFTGKPCKHGHIDIRSIRGPCLTCQAINSNNYYHANKTTISENKNKATAKASSTTVPNKRSVAVALGINRYFTGKPCKHGHIDIHYVNGGCKTCQRLRMNSKYQDNKEQILVSARLRRTQNLEATRARARAYYSANKPLYAKRHLAAYAKNRERILKYQKDYYAKNRDKVLAREHQRWATSKNNMKERRAAYMKLYEAKNKNRLRAQASEYVKQRRKSDPIFIITIRLRGRLAAALKKRKRLHKFNELIGCTKAALVQHIESQFLPGMSWDRMNEIHIDHIIPCSHFDLTQLEQQKQCFHYTNLRPMWAKDNLRKGAKGYHPLPDGNSFQMTLPII